MAIVCCAASCRKAGNRELPVFPADNKGMATRDASGQALNAIARKNVPWLLGGSADLGPSCKTRLTFAGAGDFNAENPGRTKLPLWDPGARHGRRSQWLVAFEDQAVWIRVFDLQRLRPRGDPAERLDGNSRHSHLHSRFHRRGEDGPTHQPVEHLTSLRAIPGLLVLRPADAAETVEAWRVIMPLRHEPVALILTRQALPVLNRAKYASAEGVARGAYILADADDGKPEVLLLASGSEVSLCINAYEKLKTDGIKARVVSMPSWELFEQYCREHPGYRDEVLPESVDARVSVEQASTLGWPRYVGRHGRSIGMETFGASAPLQELQKKFGFTVENIVEAVKQQLAELR